MPGAVTDSRPGALQVEHGSVSCGLNTRRRYRFNTGHYRYNAVRRCRLSTMGPHRLNTRAITGPTPWGFARPTSGDIVGSAPGPVTGSMPGGVRGSTPGGVTGETRRSVRPPHTLHTFLPLPPHTSHPKHPQATPRHLARTLRTLHKSNL